jgi:hypothetical protein
MTPAERLDAFNLFVHDRAHAVIEQTVITIVARSASPVIDGAQLVHVAVQAAFSSGIELGIRAALLDPPGAERLRDAFAPGAAVPAGISEAEHVSSALHQAQTILDVAGGA